MNVAYGTMNNWTMYFRSSNQVFFVQVLSLALTVSFISPFAFRAGCADCERIRSAGIRCQLPKILRPLSNLHHATLKKRSLSFILFNEPTSHNEQDSSKSLEIPMSEEKHVKNILFVECGTLSNYDCSIGVNFSLKLLLNCVFHTGFGSDAHGQNSTKAAGKL
jgi:hypothetical protein